MNRNDLFTRDKYVLLDGGMGTMLQARGLKLGARPELLSITEPEMLTGIHREYVQAGADIVYANTFGASAKKLEGSGYSVAEVISASLACARRAVQGTGALGKEGLQCVIIVPVVVLALIITYDGLKALKTGPQKA